MDKDNYNADVAYQPCKKYLCSMDSCNDTTGTV